MHNLEHDEHYELHKHTTTLHSASFSNLPTLTHRHTHKTTGTQPGALRQGIQSSEEKGWVLRADLMMLWKNSVGQRVG